MHSRSLVRGSVWSLGNIAKIGPPVKISVSFSGLSQTTALEVLLRFGLGGLVTAVAGMIAMQFGPVIGGLFLAFPSIFPAAATIVEKHEAKKKQKAGRRGKKRGRSAAGADAAGAALGSVGLLGFGLIVWKLAPTYGRGLVLGGACLMWFSIALLCWLIRKQAYKRWFQHIATDVV